MSLLSPHGFQLQWKTNGPYTTREACPNDGDSHRDCGLVSTTIPGFPRGLIEIRPAEPHQKGTAWNYAIDLGKGVEISGIGLSGCVSCQHAMLHRVPYLTKGRRWVVCQIDTLRDRSWKASLRLGLKMKEMDGPAEGSIELSVLTAARAVLSALKQPALLRISEPSGVLRATFDGGFWPGTGGEVGTLMAAVEALSLPHFVRLDGKVGGP